MNLFYRFFVLLILFGLFSGCKIVYQPVAKTVPKEGPIVNLTLEDLDPGHIKWHKGDQWEYSDGYTLEVVEIKENIARLERVDKGDSIGNWVERDGFFKAGSKTGDTFNKTVFRYPEPSGLFPLVVGKNVSFKREFLSSEKEKTVGTKKQPSTKQEKQLMVHQSTWKVIGQEKITVPAGVFNCWVLEWRTRSTLRDWSGYERWWYSPKVRNYVRLEYKYGKKPASSRVLMKYKTIPEIHTSNSNG
ncbi:MAG: hypothetical protein HQL69_24200 [Magnetococcales bacterium]|nr:hypothetical protein [Magnetococcales bacterium]